MHAAKCCCPGCADSRYRRRRAACTFMHKRHGSLLVLAVQPAATRPVLKLLVFFDSKHFNFKLFSSVRDDDDDDDNDDNDKIAHFVCVCFFRAVD